MNYRISWLLAWICLGVGIVVMMVGAPRANEPTGLTLAIIGAVVALGGVVQRVAFYRCPNCGGSLANVRGGIPAHCPHCGEELK